MMRVWQNKKFVYGEIGVTIFQQPRSSYLFIFCFRLQYGKTYAEANHFISVDVHGILLRGKCSWWDRISSDVFSEQKQLKMVVSLE